MKANRLKRNAASRFVVSVKVTNFTRKRHCRDIGNHVGMTFMSHGRRFSFHSRCPECRIGITRATLVLPNGMDVATSAFLRQCLPGRIKCQWILSASFSSISDRRRDSKSYCGRMNGISLKIHSTPFCLQSPL